MGIAALHIPPFEYDVRYLIVRWLTWRRWSRHKMKPWKISHEVPVCCMLGTNPIPPDTDFSRAPPGETVNASSEAFKMADEEGNKLLGERGRDPQSVVVVVELHIRR